MRNEDAHVPHTLTADDGSFDTGNINGGSSATFTAPSAPGTYTFVCVYHSSMAGMHGTLIVS